VRGTNPACDRRGGGNPPYPPQGGAPSQGYPGRRSYEEYE